MFLLIIMMTISKIHGSIPCTSFTSVCWLKQKTSNLGEKFSYWVTWSVRLFRQFVYSYFCVSRTLHCKVCFNDYSVQHKWPLVFLDPQSSDTSISQISFSISSHTLAVSLVAHLTDLPTQFSSSSRNQPLGLSCVHAPFLSGHGFVCQLYDDGSQA